MLSIGNNFEFLSQLDFVWSQAQILAINSPSSNGKGRVLRVRGRVERAPRGIDYRVLR